MLSSLDTIVSSHSMGGAYGRSIAYTAIFEGASFATTESSKLFRLDEGVFAFKANRQLLTRSF